MKLPSQALLALLGSILLSAQSAQAGDAKLVLVENADISDARLHFPLLITGQQGFRIRCAAQADEENVIRGLGFVTSPSDVLSTLDPVVVAAAPDANPFLCPTADDYKIKVFAFSDETGLNHYLQFPTARGSTSYVNRLYRPRCAGLVAALGIDLAQATNADPRPFFGDALYDIDCFDGVPIEVRPDTFAKWCLKTDLTEAQRKTVDAILDATPAGSAARGNPGACASAQTFLTSVKSLNLSDSVLSDLSPLSVLPNLTTLVLENNAISDVGPLANLTALVFLDLSGNQLANLAPLSLLTSLTEIDLQQNQISNLRPLSPLVSMTRLDLSQNQITDVSPLRFLLALSVLDLGGNQLTGAGVEPLTALSVLQRLDLTNNKLETIEVLSQFGGSTEILLAGNPVFGDDTLTFAELCVLHRADATPFGHTIRALVTQSGAQNCDDAASALQSSPTLDLSGKSISDVGPIALIPNLRTLNLSSNSIVDVSPLTAMTGLVSLNLATNSIVEAAGIAKLTNLTSLDLTGNPVNVSGFLGACLVRNHAGMLTEVQAAEMTILMAFAGQAKCLDASEALARATDVTLDNMGLKTVAYFPVFENARRLVLNGNQLVDAAPLVSLSRVRSLNLAGNQIATLADINKMSSLQSLNLSGNPVASLNGISALQQLATIQLSDTKVRNVRPLAELPSLVTARLDHLDISYGDMEDYCLVRRLDSGSLADTRAFMVALEPRLASDGIDAGNCPAVAAWAGSVETLTLNKANLLSIEPIRFFTNLRSLTMFDNQIEDAVPVRNLARLETLNLSQNRIETIPTLQSTTIKTLNMQTNRIASVNTLSQKTSITSLDLSGNRISDARPLNGLTAVTFLDLRSNQIEEESKVKDLFPRKPYIKGNPVCSLPVIMIFPPPPIVDACRREPLLILHTIPGVFSHNLEENTRPLVINPQIHRRFP